jgi:hypothetical protein
VWESLARCDLRLIPFNGPTLSYANQDGAYAPRDRSALGLLAELACSAPWRMAGAAFLRRIDGITKPSLSTRELQNALLAREYYFGSGKGTARL